MKNNFGLTEQEMCLAERCADFVVSDANLEALAVTMILIKADSSSAHEFIMSYAASCLFNYIKQHSDETLSDQLFGHLKEK